MHRLALFLLLTAAVATAQRGAGFHCSPAPAGHFRGYGSGYAGARAFSPLLYSGGYYDSLLDAGYPVASQPPLIILQSAPSAERGREVSASPKDPLLIEWQGDRYVRLSGDENAGIETIDRSAYIAKQKAAPTPALLVFRDGHQEEVAGYTIAAGAIYVDRNDATNGFTTRRIDLSLLDLPRTFDSNQARGVPFQLPTAANVVIVAP
jgi:hypothetical protein